MVSFLFFYLLRGNPAAGCGRVLAGGFGGAASRDPFQPSHEDEGGGGNWP